MVTSLHIETFTGEYYLSFYDSGALPKLHIWRGFHGLKFTEINGLSDILDYLKQNLSKKDYASVEKFCFENI